RPFVATLRQFPEGYRRNGMEETRVRNFERVMEEWLRKGDIADELWINARDPSAFGCCIGAPLRRPGPLSPQEKHRWSCLGAHVATAFRIRRQFSGRSPECAEDAMRQPEAILDSRGKLAHAEGPATNGGARAALRDAVRALERAR